MFRTFLAATLIVSLLNIFGPRCFAEETADENLFQKGLAAYQNKQYQEAADAYQKLLSEGVVSAPLLHNLALAEYQLDQKPLALALWRKALDIDPGYRAARTSRDIAESKLQVRSFDRDPLSDSLHRTLEFVSLQEILWLIALLLGATGWLWIRYASERRFALQEERPLPGFPVAAISLSVISALCLGLLTAKINQELQTRATVIQAHVSARSLPSDDGVALFDLNGGTEVLVKRKNGDWSQVQNSEGASGWLRKDEIFVTSGR
jgi:tetratricopeptide (TPR) repeat protein